MPFGYRYRVQLGKMLDANAHSGEATEPYLRNLNVQWGRLDLSDLKEMPFNRAEQAKFALKRGDLLVCEGGEVGRACVLDRDLAGIFYQKSLHRVRPIRDVDSSNYAYWCLQAAAAAGGFTDTTKSTINHLTAERLRREPFPFPPRDDQISIAAFLDRETARIDEVVEGVKSLMARIDERMWSATSELFREFPRAPLRRFLRSISDGPFGSALTSSHYSDTGTRVVRLGNVGRGFFKPDDTAYVSDAYGRQLRQHALAAGDLIIAGLGDTNQPLGRACVVPPHVLPAINKADCYRVRLDDRVDHRFAAIWLSCPDTAQKVALLARGSTRTRLNTDVVRSVPMAFAEREVQNIVVDEFAEITRRTELTLDGLRDLRVRLLRYRSSLITEAITGLVDARRTSRGETEERLARAVEGAL